MDLDLLTRRDPGRDTHRTGFSRWGHKQSAERGARGCGACRDVDALDEHGGALPRPEADQRRRAASRDPAQVAPWSAAGLLHLPAGGVERRDAWVALHQALACTAVAEDDGYALVTQAGVALPRRDPQLADVAHGCGDCRRAG